ncbi:MAG: MaoC family dehydratase [Woeseiaceae bacterium]|nr:MaoC family dehydratase [Woeseiaceae bacterium]
MARKFAHPKDLLDAVGESLGPSDWTIIEQERIDKFADATEDRQWIHVDPERAASGPFGTTIAHGFLTLSLVNKFLPQIITVNGTVMAINYGCDRVRFPNTVKAGARVRGTGEIVSAEEKPGAVQAIVRIFVEVEGAERPACVADTISRFYYAE